jgi:hypothetical protein
VERLRWISATLFLEFLALSQCLPGPTSTQVSFALGVVSKGVSGGLISGAPAAMRLADAAHVVLQSAQCLGCSVAEKRKLPLEGKQFSGRETPRLMCASVAESNLTRFLSCRHSVPVPRVPDCFPRWRGCCQLSEGPRALAAWPSVRYTGQASCYMQPSAASLMPSGQHVTA